MEKQERDISLQQLLWRILFNWRVLLLCAVIFAVLLGALSYVRGLKTYQAASEPQETEEIEFTDEEQEQIDQAVSISQYLEDYQEYMDSSVLMTMDPYQQNVLTLQYYVDSDYTFNYTQDNKTDYTEAVVTAYCEGTTGENMMEKLSEALGCDVEYARELFSTENVGSGIFEIHLIYSDKSVLQQVVDVIHAEIASQTEAISQNVGSHSLVLLSENIVLKANKDLANTQQENWDKIEDYSSTLTKLKESMTEEQLAAVEEVVTDETEEVEEEVEEEVVAQPEISAKYVVLGAIIGIVLAAFLIAVKICMAGELQEAGEITEYYNLQLMGTLPSDQRKRRNVIDKLLLQIRYRNRERLSEEKSLDIVEANIELTCKTENVSQVYFVSSIPDALQGEVWQKLQDKLKAVEIEVIYGGQVCYDSQLLREMTEVGNVIVVEQVGKSISTEINREITLIGDRGLRILGGIVTEAM